MTQSYTHHSDSTLIVILIMGASEWMFIHIHIAALAILIPKYECVNLLLKTVRIIDV